MGTQWILGWSTPDQTAPVNTPLNLAFSPCQGTQGIQRRNTPLFRGKMLCNQSAVCWAILDLSKEGPLGRPALGAKGELQADLPLMGEGACSSPMSLGPVFLVPKVELGTSLPRHAQGFNMCNLGLCHLLAWNFPLVPAVLVKPSSPLWLGRPLSPLCSQVSPIPQMLQAPSSLRAFARAVFAS